MAVFNSKHSKIPEIQRQLHAIHGFDLRQKKAEWLKNPEIREYLIEAERLNFGDHELWALATLLVCGDFKPETKHDIDRLISKLVDSRDRPAISDPERLSVGWDPKILCNAFGMSDLHGRAYIPFKSGEWRDLEMRFRRRFREADGPSGLRFEGDAELVKSIRFDLSCLPAERRYTFRKFSLLGQRLLGRCFPRDEARGLKVVLLSNIDGKHMWQLERKKVEIVITQPPPYPREPQMVCYSIRLNVI